MIETETFQREWDNLQAALHKNSQDHGFWDDYDALMDSDLPQNLKDFIDENVISNKLMLTVSELVEAHDEIRSGIEINVTYYKHPDFPGVRLSAQDVVLYKEQGKIEPGLVLKPEGGPSEIVDAIIRLFDLAGKKKIDTFAMIGEKAAYNAQRARLHGRKF